MRRETKHHKALWAVQLAQYPDSVELRMGQVLRMHQQCRPWGEHPRLRARELKDPFYVQLYNERVHKWEMQKLEMERSMLMSIAVALSNTVSHGEKPGIFYLCGKQEDGTYQWMGYRYGYAPSEYMSGFGHNEKGWELK